MALKCQTKLLDNDHGPIQSGNYNEILSLEHENVIKTFEIMKKDNKFFQFMSYAESGSMENHMSYLPGDDLNMSIAISFFKSMLSGIQYMHQSGLVHRDLKPSNILLENGVPKVSDLDLMANENLLRFKVSGLCGSPHFVAPESWDLNWSIQSDLWSCGVMLYIMLSGEYPFATHDFRYLRSAICTSPFKPLDKSIPGEVRRIVEALLEKNPCNRPRSATQVIECLEIYDLNCDEDYINLWLKFHS